MNENKKYLTELEWRVSRKLQSYRWLECYKDLLEKELTRTDGIYRPYQIKGLRKLIREEKQTATPFTAAEIECIETIISEPWSPKYCYQLVLAVNMLMNDDSDAV